MSEWSDEIWVRGCVVYLHPDGFILLILQSVPSCSWICLIHHKEYYLTMLIGSRPIKYINIPLHPYVL